MSIREQAAHLGHQIIGQLTRRPDLECNAREQTWLDEAGNTYLTRWGILTIITATGTVI